MTIDKRFLLKEYELLGRLGISYLGLEWCELGNQHLKDVGLSGPAKCVYESRGVKHTSIDINGEDGALPFNLSLPLPMEYSGRFDIVTNYGVSEHVDNQKYVFKNIDYITKPGGIMVHVVPEEGSWKGHCEYYYTQDFFYNLSSEYNYSIIELSTLSYTPKKSLVWAVLRK